MADAALNGQGKGEGTAQSPEAGKGHLLPRTRLSAEKFTGVVLNWRGKFGFIKPDENIEHEKASLRSGNIFTCIDDLQGAQWLEVGAPVEFHISEDETGLVAEEVVQAGPGNPAKGGKGKATKGWSKGWGGSPWAQADAGWGGKASPKGWWSSVPVWSTISKPQYQAEKGKGGKGGKGGGHLLPRTRISEMKVAGTVAEWKGKYGWIQPTEPVEHEKATKNNGRIFVSKDDIVGVEQLSPGSAVEFYVWEDASGLGADEVVQS